MKFAKKIKDMETQTVNNQTFVLDKELITILNENWQDYDTKKLAQGAGQKNINAIVNWEVDYIVNKICNKLPHYTIENCRKAINIICIADHAPASRPRFLEQVMSVLYLL